MLQHKLDRFNAGELEISARKMCYDLARFTLESLRIPQSGLETLYINFFNHIVHHMNNGLHRKQHLGENKQQHFLNIFENNIQDSPNNEDAKNRLSDIIISSLSDRENNPLLTNRGTGAYFWCGLFKPRNPIDGSICRSTTESHLVRLYNNVLEPASAA